jgi:hypothetical protein
MSSGEESADPSIEAIHTVASVLKAAGDERIFDELEVARSAAVSTDRRADEADPTELAQLEHGLWRRLSELAETLDEAQHELGPIAAGLQARRKAEGRAAESRVKTTLVPTYAKLGEIVEKIGLDLQRIANQAASESDAPSSQKDADDWLAMAKQIKADTSVDELGPRVRALHEELGALEYQNVSVSSLRRQARRLRRRTWLLRNLPGAVSVVVSLGIFTLGAEVLLQQLTLGLVLPIVAVFWALERWQVEPRLAKVLLARRRSQVHEEVDNLLALEVQVLLGVGLARLNARDAINPTPQTTAALELLGGDRPTHSSAG